ARFRVAHCLRSRPPLTFGLYTLSDTLAVLLLNPFYNWLRTHGRKNPTIRRIGQRALSFAMLGVLRPTPEEVREGRLAPALLRIATVGFGVDIYTAGALVTGLPVPRLVGWSAAMVGDLLWFALLLGSSVAAAHLFNDERATAGVVLIVTFV